MKKFILICFFLFSCDSNVIDPNGPDIGDRLSQFNVKLRIHNNSAFDLNDINSNNSNFGNLAASEYSDYEGFSIIHTYPEISAIVNSVNVAYPGFISNDPMFEIGWYTLQVNGIDTASNTISAVIDRDN